METEPLPPPPCGTGHRTQDLVFVRHALMPPTPPLKTNFLVLPVCVCFWEKSSIKKILSPQIDKRSFTARHGGTHL